MIDIGANLTNKSFKNDLANVLHRAKDVGVTHIVVTGTSLDASRIAKEQADKHSMLSYTAGVHPHDADDVETDWLDGIKNLAVSGAVALGETGLDYFRNFSSRDSQQSVFRAQLELAADLDMPVFVHDRDSEGDVLRYLTTYARTDVVVHCFTGDQESLDAYIDLGCYIGITGWVCDPVRGKGLAELVRRIPDDRLMIETDSPYLLPKNINPKPQSRRNEPANLIHVNKKVAEARDQTESHVAQITTENASRFFRLDVT